MESVTMHHYSSEILSFCHLVSILKWGKNVTFAQLTCHGRFRQGKVKCGFNHKKCIFINIQQYSDKNDYVVK